MHVIYLMNIDMYACMHGTHVSLLLTVDELPPVLLGLEGPVDARQRRPAGQHRGREGLRRQGIRRSSRHPLNTRAHTATTTHM